MLQGMVDGNMRPNVTGLDFASSRAKGSQCQCLHAKDVRRQCSDNGITSYILRSKIMIIIHVDVLRKY